MPRLSCCLYLALAACGGGGGFPDAKPPDSAAPTGTFSLSWSVLDQNNQPITCDRIAGQAMTVLEHNLAYASGDTQIFSCATGMGTSQGIVPGTYEMAFELSGTFGTLATGTKQNGVLINAQQNTELAPVTFQVTALGGVGLKIASGKPGGNCGATNAQPPGAGIDQMSITLKHNSNGACEPLILNISDGATQTGGTYMIDCTTPVLRGCIEADQVLSAANIPSDSYSITVKGMVGGKTCWLNGDSIQVPPLNNTLIRTLFLAQQTSTPGC